MRYPSLSSLPRSSSAVLLPAAAPQNQGFLGRWNLTGTGEDANRVYWLEVTEEGGQLSGMFLNRGGSPVPLASVAVAGQRAGLPARRPATTSSPAPSSAPRSTAASSSARPRPPTARSISSASGRRSGRPSNANAKHTYGTPVELFDGKSLRRRSTPQPSTYPITLDGRGRRR